MKTKDVIGAYYRAWIESDRAAARALLADDLEFRSPEDDFDGADAFLESCWAYAEGFDSLRVEHEVYGDEGGYVVYTGSGGLCCGELIKVRDGLIREIYVTFDPTR